MQTPMSELQWGAQFGAAFVFALVMFYIYRQDRKHSEEHLAALTLTAREEARKDRDLCEARLERLAQDFRAIVIDNTAALTELKITLRSIEENTLAALDRAGIERKRNRAE